MFSRRFFPLHVRQERIRVKSHCIRQELESFSQPMSKTIIVPESQIALAVIPSEAVALRDKAIEAAKAITAILAENVDSAVENVSILKGMASAVEKLRKELTAPHLEFNRDLKAKADSYCEPALSEASRIERLLAQYQAEQRRLAALEQERIAREEAARIKKIEDDKREQSRIIREAEEARLRAEQVAASQVASAHEIEVAKVEAQNATEAADALAFGDFGDDEPVFETIPAVIVDSRIAGGAFKEVTEVEVTDPVALARYALFSGIGESFELLAHRMIEIKPKNQGIKDFIEVLERRGIPLEIPGVKITKGAAKFSVRAASPARSARG